MYEYSAFVGVDGLQKKRDEVASLAVRHGLTVEIYSEHMEFEYSGRDSGRRVRAFIHDLAPVVEDVDGEFVCVVTDDVGSDPSFEFYSIRDGVAYVEHGQVVRGEPHVVDP